MIERFLIPVFSLVSLPTEAIAEPVTFPDWLLPSSPFILAIIAGVVTLVVRKIRGPVAVPELWAENRKLREDMMAMEDRFNKKISDIQTRYETERREQANVNRTMGDGFIALSGYIQRTTLGKTRPDFTTAEARAINAARDLLGDDVWATVPGLS